MQSQDDVDDGCTEDSLLLPGAQRNGTADTADKTLRYPVPVYFIIGYELFERYSHYAIQTILALYMTSMLGYNESDSTSIFHLYMMAIYLLPVIGPVLADTWIGNFMTVFYFSLVYLVGNILITLGSASNYLHIDAKWTIFTGLLLNSIGTGVLKPCISTFGGEQFKLPEQQGHLDRFFSIFIFAINVSSLLAMFLSPVLRHDITCLGEASCYPLAYGTSVVTMFLAIVIFVAGYKTYKHKIPEGNVLVEVSNCIWYAIRVKRCEPKAHWLDKADDKFSLALIQEIKSTLRVMALFFPLPVYWALMQQLASRWTLQAAEMNGEMGFYTIKPEQVQMVNSLLNLAFIPLFDVAIYPLLAKCRLIRTPLQKLGAGMLLAAIAFVLSALVEFKLESTYAVVPGPHEAQLRLLNTFNCSLEVQLELTPGNNTAVHIDALGMVEMLHIPTSQDELIISANIIPSTECESFIAWSAGTIAISQHEAVTYLISLVNNSSGDIVVRKALPYDDLRKSFSGRPKVRILLDTLSNETSRVSLMDISDLDKIQDFDLPAKEPGTNFTEIDSSSYFVVYDNITETEMTMTVNDGGVYILMLINRAHDNDTWRLFTVTAPNSIPLYWSMPQHVLLTMSEVMVSITGLTFAFTQAPDRMKTVLAAAWLMTVSFGNIIVIAVAEGNKFVSQAYEYLLFAGLMMAALLLFIVAATRYTYVNTTSEATSITASESAKQYGYKTFQDHLDS